MKEMKTRIIMIMLSTILFGGMISLLNEREDLRNEIVELRNELDESTKVIQLTKEESEILQQTNVDCKNQIDELTDQMDRLHNIVSYPIGLSTLELMQEYSNDEIDKALISFDDRRPNPQVVFYPSNVRVLSNANIKQLDSILVGTRLEGFGKVYYDLEKKHNVNAIFAIANAFQESGYNQENGYTQRNNIYGITNGTFTSLEDCIEFYFNLIDSEYVVARNLYSVEDIQPVYCPPDMKWDDGIISIANKLISTINTTVE